jgi:hypothetical protein
MVGGYIIRIPLAAQQEVVDAFKAGFGAQLRQRRSREQRSVFREVGSKKPLDDCILNALFATEMDDAVRVHSISGV